MSGTKSHYLPHHWVLAPLKSTTKVRIVFNASVKAENSSNSLNECLIHGPVILPDLIGLFIRFRLYWIFIQADVEKVFLQIGIQETELMLHMGKRFVSTC